MLLSQAELSQLISTGYCACLHGDPGYSFKLFSCLNQVYPKLEPVRLGLALAYIVTDDFARADRLLEEIDSDEAVSLRVISLTLQHEYAKAEELLDKLNPDSLLGLTAAQWLKAGQAHA